MRLDSPNEYYLAISQELVSLIQEPWLRVRVEVNRQDDYLDIKTVYDRPDGTSESDVYSVELGEYFFDLAKIISNEEKGLYKGCLFTLEPDGNFNVDFRY